jgi:hypothetical protein
VQPATTHTMREKNQDLGSTHEVQNLHMEWRHWGKNVNSVQKTRIGERVMAEEVGRKKMTLCVENLNGREENGRRGWEWN